MPIPYRLNPLGISVREELPLTFTAVEASTVKLTATGSPTVSGLHYRLGTSGPWLPYTIGNTINLAVGKKVQFWNSAETLSRSSENYVQFEMTGEIVAAGKLNSLLNGAALSNGCFWLLFSGCSAMKSAPELPNEEIARTNCYYGMFMYTGIVHPPVLPATSLGASCYTGMFAYCADMIETPVLPALNLATQCYWMMFRGCSSITSVVLPAATLENTCYRQMFQDASALSSVEVGFRQWNTATDNWMLRVAASGTFIKPAALPEEYGANRIPSGWTVINK